MAKNGKKDPVARARKKAAKAQQEYLKAVAKGERQIRNVRALVDEQIARARAEFEMRASALAELERTIPLSDGRNAAVGPVDGAAEVIGVAALAPVAPDGEVMTGNGSRAPTSKKTDRRKSGPKKTATEPPERAER